MRKELDMRTTGAAATPDAVTHLTYLSSQVKHGKFIVLPNVVEQMQSHCHMRV